MWLWEQTVHWPLPPWYECNNVQLYLMFNRIVKYIITTQWIHKYKNKENTIQYAISAKLILNFLINFYDSLVVTKFKTHFVCQSYDDLFFFFIFSTYGWCHSWFRTFFFPLFYYFHCHVINRMAARIVGSSVKVYFYDFKMTFNVD